MNLNVTEPKLIALAAVAIILLVVVAWLYLRNHSTATANLKRKFGTEYDRAVGEFGSEGLAQTKLTEREERVGKFCLRDLSPMEHERFSQQWEAIQSRFVDSPRGAVAEADDLVSSMMRTRGYPISNFNQRAADISVDHPLIMKSYRSAHQIALQVGKDEATTEDLRTAMINYRSLFDELVLENKKVA